jgi:hypothetical protein
MQLMRSGICELFANGAIRGHVVVLPGPLGNSPEVARNSYLFAREHESRIAGAACSDSHGPHRQLKHSCDACDAFGMGLRTLVPALPRPVIALVTVSTCASRFIAQGTSLLLMRRGA